ncbi:hypothetical protein CDL12_02657 [Handroanthus impetiginosus]|uniref:Uncharacterized protein n=1 Tax=Handroanthus impetiginosus TaxID=429701 RepID=A0A2G9I4C2_9LAMI|nr:hypothetical protein CDL12_02657 [Handroanthus impetiginosus]
MAGRYIAANQMSNHRIENDMGSIVSPKLTLNLMQNCDLPPPLKLISGPDETFLTSISKIHGLGRGQEAEENNQKLFHTYKDCSGDDKLELLKALRLSQSRAREAERKLTVLTMEKDVLSNLLVQDSLRLFAHRQWITLLEFQVLKLQRQLEDRHRNYAAPGSPKDHYENSGSNKWGAAIALLMAITGMGYALGYRYFF